MKLYSLKDKGFGFTQIYTATNNFAALRAFSDLVNGKQPSLISEHPEDFSLFELGEIDQDTGNITPCVKFLEEASVLKKQNKETS